MTNHILVIDDEESIRFTFKHFLEDKGHMVVTAHDYNSALKQLKEKDFDMVFADIILGDRSGIEILKDIKDENPAIPVIMITGAPNLETASEAVRLGAFEYIQKPILQDTLIHVTNLALQHKALQDEKDKYRNNLEAIFRSVHDAILTVDKEMVVLEANEAVKEICGLSRDIIGSNLSSLPLKCNGKCVDSLHKTIQDKETVEINRLECHRGDNHSQVVSLKTTPLLNSKGSFSGAVLVVRDETRLHDLERDLKERRQYHNIIGKSDKMQNIYTLLDDLADVQTTVLMTGESGTGKEVIAEALHYKGERREKPLVKVNCSALSENLLESELFGHIRGAFTGAVKDKVGRFQLAHGGTIFLDEIGDISPRMQVQLLRVLQEKEFERVGESTPIKVDVRVIAATNQNLLDKIKTGKFREDLYYRLKVIEIEIPPLRERRDDIPSLIKHFLMKFNTKFNKNIVSLSEEVQKLFMDYSWPGNVRELEHTLEHAFILCHQDTITAHHLPSHIRSGVEKAPSLFNETEEKGLSRQRIIEALDKAGWNKSKAARILGINVRTIYRKIKKHGIVETGT
jgi:PAS domain S-box-containing protein